MLTTPLTAPAVLGLAAAGLAWLWLVRFSRRGETVLHAVAAIVVATVTIVVSLAVIAAVAAAVVAFGALVAVIATMSIVAMVLGVAGGGPSWSRRY